jgi:hypothetical protein
VYVVIWLENGSWWAGDGFVGYEEGPPDVFGTYEDAKARTNDLFSDKVVTYDEAMMIAAAEELCT